MCFRTAQVLQIVLAHVRIFLGTVAAGSAHAHHQLDALPLGHLDFQGPQVVLGVVVVQGSGGNVALLLQRLVRLVSDEFQLQAGGLDVEFPG